MDNLEIAKALLGQKAPTQSSGQTTTTYGIATSDSADGIVMVNLGGDTVSTDDDQTIEVETTFAVFEGDEVIVQLVGADGTGKAPCVIGVVGRGDQMQTEINAVQNYFWTDQYGAHVSTEEHSVNGANVLLDSDSLDIRVGSSNSEADQTVLASFGSEVTIGSRMSGTSIGSHSFVLGNNCEASGAYAHAEGAETRARSSYSHAEGWSTWAEGHWSHSEGNYTHAIGDCSHAEGNRTEAWSDYQHVQGKYNVIDDQSEYLDIIGNGSVGNRHNAYNLLGSGSAEFAGEVYVGGCTPNGETPYPVVRYNTSNSKQEYYDKANSAWAQVPGGGGGGGWTSLWTNSAPSSSFAAQTIPLDLSGYTVIAIACKQQDSTNISMAIPCFGFVGNTLQCCVPNIGSTQYFYKRTATIASNGIDFSTGYRNTTGTAGTNYCIPVAIYGVC